MLHYQIAIAHWAYSGANSPSNCTPSSISVQEANLKNYAFVAAIGLVLGFAMVWWIRPDTSAGAIFVAVATILFCFVVSGALPLLGRLIQKSRASLSRVEKHDDIT